MDESASEFTEKQLHQASSVALDHSYSKPSQNLRDITVQTDTSHVAAQTAVTTGMSDQAPSTSRQSAFICAAGTCDASDHLFKWRAKTSDQWTRFVRMGRKAKSGGDWNPNTASRLCFRHFQEDSFSNLSMYKAMSGETIRLQLKDTAVPSIQLEQDQWKTIHSPRKQGHDVVTMGARERRGIIRQMTAEPVPIVPRLVTVTKRIPAPQMVKEPVAVTTTHTKCTQTLRNIKTARVRSKATQYEEMSESLVEEEAGGEVIKQPTESSVTITALKREPVELVEEISDTESELPDVEDKLAADPEWLPDDEEREVEFDEMEDNQSLYKQSRGQWYDETKYFVTHTKLMELLSQCEYCSSFANVEVQNRQGAYIKFRATCTNRKCGHSRYWENSDKLGERPLINILISAAVLFSGSLPAKFLRAMNTLCVMCPSPATFFDHQKTYLHGIIRNVYARKMIEAQRFLMDKPLNIHGDGRFSSPGHTALYGCYTFMCAETSLIVACQVLKSTETGSSNAIELEGLIRCREEVESCGLNVVSLTTDQHQSIAKYMRKFWKITHYFDTWHVAKGIKKKLSALFSKSVKTKWCLKWIPGIINHFYKCVSAAGRHTVLREEMWKSTLNHLCNIHTHPDNQVYKECQHGELPSTFVDEEGKHWKRGWLDNRTILHKDVAEILTGKRLMNALGMSGDFGTSELESYHADINRNAPKMQGFSYHGQVSRVQLTVMDHNENCQRSVKFKKDGTPLFVVSRNKATSLVPKAVMRREDRTYRYVDELFLELEKHLVDGTKPQWDSTQPKTQASTGPSYTDISELVEKRKTRGLKVKPHYIPVELYS